MDTILPDYAADQVSTASAMQPDVPFLDWLATMSLARRYRTRLASLWASYERQEPAPRLLGEFNRVYRSEVRVSLFCASSVIIMAFDCQTSFSQLHPSTVASLNYLLPLSLWVLSVCYALLSLLVNVTFSDALCSARASEHSATTWVKNSRRVRLRGCMSLPALLALPHVWSAYSIMYFVAYKAISQLSLQSASVDPNIAVAVKLPRSLPLAVTAQVTLSVIHAVHSIITFRRIGHSMDVL